MLRLGAWPEEFFASAVKMLSQQQEKPQSKVFKFFTYSFTQQIFVDVLGNINAQGRYTSLP